MNVKSVDNDGTVKRDTLTALLKCSSGAFTLLPNVAGEMKSNCF